MTDSAIQGQCERARPITLTPRSNVGTWYMPQNTGEVDKHRIGLFFMAYKMGFKVKI